MYERLTIASVKEAETIDHSEDTVETRLGGFRSACPAVSLRL